MPEGPLTKDERLFFQRMELVERLHSPESYVDDFAAFLMHMLDYDNDNRVICQRTELSFVMAGQRVHAKPNVCLMGTVELLLIQENKRALSNEDPEPQVIAEVIAAFYHNNIQRQQAGLQPLQYKYIPAITMVGTAPVFYRISVTTSLLHALANASYPQEEVIALKFIPPVPNSDQYLKDGMRPLDNRRIILQCFEAFKAVIN